MITRADEPIPLPLLITGVAGVAGYNALHYFRARYPGQVIAIRQADNWPLSGDGIVACDAEDHVRLRALFDEYQFQSVLNCAGNCALRACELDSRLGVADECRRSHQFAFDCRGARSSVRCISRSTLSIPVIASASALSPLHGV